ncbi:MAG: hypothetical protein OJF52_003816 [Nitrospira sp.]|nr:MAG: hypothetical protein OJF52_003816 [Nitrospira sp.]
MKQYVEATRGEPARRHATKPHAGLLQRRVVGCSRTFRE